MNISQRVKKIRLIRNYNQGGVARMMNTTQQAYSILERNADTARLDTLKRYCQAVGVSLAFLISETPINDKTV